MGDFRGVLALLLVILALAPPGLAFGRESWTEVDFELYSGQRTDSLDWSIGNDLTGTATPNILSELTWDDLDIYQVGAECSLRGGNSLYPFHWLVTGYVNYGSIFAGDNQDSDYNGDNRTLEYSRSYNDAGAGDVWDISLATGPEFVLIKKVLTLSPLLGYSYHEQNLTIADGYQAIPADGYFPGLDSSYSADWRGFWLGLHFELQPALAVALSTRIEWHEAEYRAEADWNLRADFRHPVSFSHYADKASGLVVRLGADFSISEMLLLTTEFAYMEWQAEDGRDTIFLADNSSSATRLNEVNWESAGIVVGLTMRFD